jgi:hypothetical protein
MCEIIRFDEEPVLCSEEDYEHLKNIKIYNSKNVYPILHDPKTRNPITLHQYVFKYLMGHEVPSDMVVDHINHNRRDCRRENLRLLTYQQNVQNRNNKTPPASGFTGVYKTESGKWQSRFGGLHISRRNTVNEAAEDYDKYIIKFVNRDGLLNFEYTEEEKDNIKVSDFTLSVSYRKLKQESLPPGVFEKTRVDGVVEYSGKLCGEYIGYSLNKDEVIAMVEKKRKEIACINKSVQDAKIITRNNDGEAIIILGGASSNVAFVDESMWHELSKWSWYESKTGYPSSRIESKLCTMHQYLTRFFVRHHSHTVIDHIDRNKMNNKITNLRLVDRRTNAQNSSRTPKPKTP